MSRTPIGDLNVRYLYYRYMNRLEKEVNVRLGFGLFGAGAVAALVGLALFVYGMTQPAESSAYFAAAQPAYALGMLALPLVLLGIVILLPPDRRLLGLAGLGLVVCGVAIAGFVTVYPGDWFGRGADHTLRVLLPYAAGVAALGLGVAASMYEHAPELIQTVTTIHEPDAGSESGSAGSSDAGSASDSEHVPGSGSASDGGDAAAVDVPEDTAVVDRGSDAPDVPEETGVVDSGPDVPDETAVVDSGSDAPDVPEETAVVEGGAVADSSDGDAVDVPDETAVADSGPDVPDETAVVDDASSAGETEVLSDSGPAGTGDGPITLVVNGRRYSFGDGDTFGRRDEPWLDDLIAAADGHEEIPYVSGEHLRFDVEDDGVYVTDQSRNGTTLNGRDVSGETARLSDGDTLVLSGRAKLGVEIDRR